jgi:RHS repeat-associated protein
VRGATSDTGSIIQNSDYLPYGPPSPQQPAATDPDFGFTGHLKCPFTGLTLAPYRVLGYANWLSRDPIGEAGGINLYSYVANNPINWVDPLGLDVTVVLYEGAGGFGHIGVGVNTGTTSGFYPNKTGLGVIAGKDTPGEWKEDKANQIKNITIKTTPEQDAAIQKHLDGQKQNPGSYNLYNRNCATQAGEALKAGGIKVPDTIRPRPFIEGLPK